MVKLDTDFGACLCMWLGTKSDKPSSFSGWSYDSEFAKPVFLPKKRSSCITCLGFGSFFKKRPSLGSPPNLQTPHESPRGQPSCTLQGWKSSLLLGRGISWRSCSGRWLSAF